MFYQLFCNPLFYTDMCDIDIDIVHSFYATFCVQCSAVMEMKSIIACFLRARRERTDTAVACVSETIVF